MNQFVFLFRNSFYFWTTRGQSCDFYSDRQNSIFFNRIVLHRRLWTSPNFPQLWKYDGVAAENFERIAKLRTVGTVRNFSDFSPPKYFFRGIAPFGTGDHNLNQLPVSVPSFSQIGWRTAEIRLAEMKKIKKITAVKHNSLPKLCVGGCKKHTQNMKMIKKW